MRHLTSKPQKKIDGKDETPKRKDHNDHSKQCRPVVGEGGSQEPQPLSLSLCVFPALVSTRAVMVNYFAWVDPEGKKRKLNANTSSIPLARFPEAAPTSELANATSHLPSTGTSPSPVSTVNAAPILSSDLAALATSASTAAEAVVPVPAVTKKKAVT